MDNFSGQLFSTLAALAFVAALAWVSLSLLKRIQQGRMPGRLARKKTEGEMRFVRALQLGTKERVVVMHYRAEEWLLGVSAGGISLLARSPLGNSEPSEPPQ